MEKKKEEEEEEEKKELERAYALIRRSVTLDKLKCLHQNVKYYASANSVRPPHPQLEADGSESYPGLKVSLTSLSLGCLCCDCGLRFGPGTIVLRAFAQLAKGPVQKHDHTDLFKAMQCIQWLHDSHWQLIYSRENMLLNCSQMWLTYLLPHTGLLSELFPLIMAFLNVNPRCASILPWTVAASDPVFGKYEYRLGFKSPTPIPASDVLQIDSSRSVQLFAHRCYLP